MKRKLTYEIDNHVTVVQQRRYAKSGDEAAAAYWAERYGYDCAKAVECREQARKYGGRI